MWLDGAFKFLRGIKLHTDPQINGLLLGLEVLSQAPITHALPAGAAVVLSLLASSFTLIVLCDRCFGVRAIHLRAGNHVWSGGGGDAAGTWPVLQSC